MPFYTRLGTYGSEGMKFYLAPLEGITGHIYRNALEKYFPGTDRYFTPFIAPDQNKILRTKERRDVLPENNRVKSLIPQILTNNSEHFIRTAKMLEELGYKEVNLNLGCPSGTVAARKRGSGFLAYPDELDQFLEEIFDRTDMKISVKTRVGRDDAKDALRLIEIYRKYPLSELIIHPRTQKEFYRGEPDQELFGELAAAYGGAEGNVCYNGNLLTECDYKRFTEKFPQTEAVMMGRGVIANPGLIHQIKTGRGTDKKTLRAFHNEVLENYRELFGEDKNALFRMKEMWIYMIHSFGTPRADADELRLIGDSKNDKYAKKIRKAQSLPEYKYVVDSLFAEQELLADGPVQWNLPVR